jgi:hypothetical protein
MLARVVVTYLGKVKSEYRTEIAQHSLASDALRPSMSGNVAREHPQAVGSKTLAGPHCT